MKDKELTHIRQEHFYSEDADKAHKQAWSGEDIPIGIYKSPGQVIEKARRNTISTLVKKLPALKKKQRILDLDSGYGETAKFLADQYKCKVDYLSSSEQKSKYAREKIKEGDVDQLVSVTTGSFEKIPFDRESYDIVWSQDALFQCSNKEKVFREIARVLKPGGRFIFTDIMINDDLPDDLLKGKHVHSYMEKMGSVRSYKKLARKAELEQVYIKEMPDHLITHLKKRLNSLKEAYKKIAQKSGEAIAQDKVKECQFRIAASEKGLFKWGILQFQKRNV